MVDIQKNRIPQSALPCLPNWLIEDTSNCITTQEIQEKKMAPGINPEADPSKGPEKPLGRAATKHADNHDDARDNRRNADENATDSGGIAGDGSQMDGRRVRKSGRGGRSSSESSAESGKLDFHDRTLSSLRQNPSLEPYLDRSRARSSPTLFVDVHSTERNNAENNTNSNENNDSKTSYVRHILSYDISSR